MSNVMVMVVSWLALAIHLIFGVISAKRGTTRPLVVSLNLVVAACVIVYWVQEWYGYIAHGIQWSATDQLVPLYAIAVAALSIASLMGRYNGNWPNWIVFAVDTVLGVAAALFFTFFRINKLF